MHIDKKTFFHLSLLTLFGFSFFGWLIIKFFSSQSFISVFERGLHIWHWQIGIGILYGLLVALSGHAILKYPYFQEVRLFFEDMISELNLSVGAVIWVSFCAGVGEEIFFRGAVQQFLGVWITACLFIILHGYIVPFSRPFNKKMAVYGIFMIFISAGLGYLYEYLGIIAAIAAHFTIDMVAFLNIRK